MRVERRRPPVAATLLGLIALVGLPGGAVAPPSAAATTAITALYIDGGWMAPDAAWYQSSISSTFSGSYDSATGVAHVSITKPGDLDHTYAIDLAAPTGQQLGVGSFPDAVEFPGGDATHAAMRITHATSACFNTAGSFAITEWQTSGTTITALAVSFTNDCSNADGTTRGELRIASTLGLQAITPSVSQLGLGDGVTGRSTTSKTLTWTARANAPTTVTSVGISGQNAADFVKGTDTCSGAVLAPAATCSVTVRMVATVVGSLTADLMVSDTTSIGPHRIALSGRGQPFSISTTMVDFGNQQLLTRANRTVTIVAGSAPLETMTTPAISGPFLFPGGTCASVAALHSCSATVAFRPEQTGAASGSFEWSVTAGDASQSQLVDVKGTGVQTSNVAWGTDRTAGRTYSWSAGYGLGKTTSGSTTYLHVIEATDLVGGDFVTDTGPHLGVYYVRTANEGATWTTSLRLNPSTQHGERPALTASGANVYAAWVTETKYDKFSPTAPRVLYVRTNTSHGSSTSWRSAVRVSSSTGRVDFPTLAANGSTVYAAYTDANTGNIRLAKSTDQGAHWTYQTVAVTTNTTTEGKAGYPVVRVSGTRVLLVWVGDTAYKVVARTSLDGGATWGAATTLATTASTYPAAAVSSDRFVVAWTAADGPRVRTNKAGVWGATTSIKINGANPYVWHDTPAVSLNGSAGTAVAWGTCSADCDHAGTVDLMWAESTDGGATFPHLQVLATQTVGANWWPSVAWSGTKRYVLYERDSADGSYRMRIRTGTGSP